MPTTLILARTWRLAHRMAAAERIPHGDRVVITCRESFAQLGYATRGLPRRVYAGFDKHPRRQEILDALWTADQYEPS